MLLDCICKHMYKSILFIAIYETVGRSHKPQAPYKCPLTLKHLYYKWLLWPFTALNLPLDFMTLQAPESVVNFIIPVLNI